MSSLAAETPLMDLVDYMAKSVVDNPQEVTVNREVEDTDYVIYQLHVSADDIGKVIGRRGRVAKAMRTLLKVASIKSHEHSVLEID
jgi:predicted RNA-binding protein YlqC (UPF0109 family)